MTPCKEITPDIAANVNFGGQGYLDLPAYMTDSGDMIATRWRLSLRERLSVLFGGSIWLSVLTFGQRLQPVRLNASNPFLSNPRDSKYTGDL